MQVVILLSVTHTQRERERERERVCARRFSIIKFVSLSYQGGDLYVIKGAADRILPMCRMFYDNGHLSPLTAKQNQNYVYQASRMGTGGLRGIVSINIAIVRTHTDLDITFTI